MTIKHTNIKDCLIIEPNVFVDKRGYFFESYNKTLFNLTSDISTEFVQDNESYSSKGVLRGLHYQKGKDAQAKLVRVIKGEVLDVAVDIRKNSETFGEHISIVLSAENKRQLFVPKGFAHGFVVLSETAVFSYKCDNYYNKDAERGIAYNDPNLRIDWKINEDDLIISDKDLDLPFLSNADL